MFVFSITQHTPDCKAKYKTAVRIFCKTLQLTPHSALRGKGAACPGCPFSDGSQRIIPVKPDALFIPLPQIDDPEHQIPVLRKAVREGIGARVRLVFCTVAVRSPITIQIISIPVDGSFLRQDKRRILICLRRKPSQIDCNRVRIHQNGTHHGSPAIDSYLLIQCDFLRLFPLELRRVG